MKVVYKTRVLFMRGCLDSIAEASSVPDVPSLVVVNNWGVKLLNKLLCKKKTIIVYSIIIIHYIFNSVSFVYF